MKLVYKDTGKLVEIGDKPKDFRGEIVGEVIGMLPPHRAGSTGRVLLKFNGGTVNYYPSVINAEWRNE